MKSTPGQSGNAHPHCVVEQQREECITLPSFATISVHWTNGLTVFFQGSSIQSAQNFGGSASEDAKTLDRYHIAKHWYKYNCSIV